MLLQLGFSKIGPPEGDRSRAWQKDFDKEGLIVKPLNLKIKQSATFRMQSCKFVRESTLRLLKAIGPVRVRRYFSL